jgi:toxin ParE1/3/4
VAHVIWTEAAERDLDDILAYYVEEAGVDVATALFYRLREQIGTLRMFPHRCRPGRVVGTREYVLHRLPYIAIVKVQDDTVAVLALTHRARLYP